MAEWLITLALQHGIVGVLALAEAVAIRKLWVQNKELTDQLIENNERASNLIEKLVERTQRSGSNK